MRNDTIIEDPGMHDITPTQARERARAGTLTLVDVRPPDERALASIGEPFLSLEADGLAEVLALPKDTPLAFLCHHGARSAQAGSYFVSQGFSDVSNIVGGIAAWADVDGAVGRY